MVHNSQCIYHVWYIYALRIIIDRSEIDSGKMLGVAENVTIQLLTLMKKGTLMRFIPSYAVHLRASKLHWFAYIENVL